MVGLNEHEIWKYNALIENVISLYQLLYPEVNYIQCLFNLGILDEKDYFFGVEIVDRHKETSKETVIRILPNIIKLINEQFDENKAILICKFRCINIIEYLEELELVTKIGRYEIEPR